MAQIHESEIINAGCSVPPILCQAEIFEIYTYFHRL
jgi:hypothetical protein